MGVPKFYRWTSERYPCLSQVIKEHQIPEFDNLYFDMNGIIHVCSHPNDDDPHFRITEADIFKNIFHYIEVLLRIIKPKKNFFMAVDGVAPRAKMNQQRGRRFRTAKEAEDNIRRALQKGQSLPKEERFDSNCITPGTEFMTRLNDHLQYFVNKKISSDPLWQGCNVYLSGHDVPGEGEHKIMDFVRYEKSQDDYDPNTRHCLYGLDADLIVLGLATHEPHLSLLREEVRFGKQSKRVSKPEETTFHLLHLSLMREYLDFEFSALKDSLTFKYDLEKIIDDWVLLGFLVGNDFIPHLPNLHINHDALPYLYKVYIETMPKLDGYLHDGGTLNLPRFQKFMDAIGKFDREKFEDIYTDMKWLEGRTGRSLSSGKKSKNGGKVKFSKLLSQMDDDIMFPVKNPYMALADVSDAFDDSLVASPPRVLDQKAGELEEMFGDMGIKDTDGGEELFEMEFRQHKRAYYTEKFDIPTADDAFISTVVYEYVLAIQWILHYYFNGLQSWSWYYPFHYAPFVSDISNTDKFDLSMNKGEPFKPFEQLLAVLPSASKKLLPDAFQSLMIMDTSPIIDYYPTSFQTDLNGKQQEWEAVVLIPFIDEQRLLSAMASNYARLTDEEKERNSYGSCLKYRYSVDVNYFCPSTYPGVFRDIDACRASCEKIDRDAFRVEIEDINKGLCDGVKENVYFPGFPTLKHINHHSNLRKAGVRVFQFSSKSNNMVIHIEETEKPDKEAMRELVGQVVHVEWPYLVEALVTAVTDGDVKYMLKEAENIVQEDIMNFNKSQDAKRWMKIVKTNNLEKKGIDIGEVHTLVEAKQLKGKRYVCGAKGNVNLEREWAATHSFYPYQSIVQNLSVHTSEFQKECKSIEELYPPKSQCFMMANPHYGCFGEVLEVDKETSRVRVALSVPPEPDLSEVITNQSSLTDRYQRIETAAQKIGISSKLLSRITGNLFVRKNSKKGPENGEKVNLGLKLKFSGRNREVLGYARREEDGWKFSESAINVLRSYVKKFPRIFEKLAYLPEQESYGEEDIFPGKTGKDVLEEVLKFLKNLPCAKVDSVKCGSNVLDERVVTAIETAVEETKLHKHMTKCVKVKVKPYVLFKPTAEFGSLVPDPSTEYYLFDRVVNVRDGGAVPLGYRGTIIGVHEVQEDEKDDDSPKEIKYEVLFDEPFLGGLMLRCQENKGAYVTSSSTLNISYGERKEAKKKGQTPTLTKLQGKAEPKSIKKTSSSSSLQGNSPFSPPRGRDRRYEGAGFGSPKESTPTSNWHDRTDYRQSPGSSWRSGTGGRKKHDSEDNFKPDYWLKDYGNKTPERGYSFGEAEDNENKKKFDSKTKITGTDFLAMLTKIDKNDEDNNSTTDNKRPSQDKERQDTIQNDPPGTTSASKSPASSAKPKSKTLQEETALLQKMLGIGSHSQQQIPTQEMGRIPNTSFHTPPRQPTSIFNQLFHGPQSSEVRMNVPASPTSPLTPGSLVVSPTSALQNWCHQNQMPAPNYTYSCTPQGVHAAVRIGPAICFGGQMCRSKPDAAESAAVVALKHLVQRQNVVEEAIAAGNHPHPSIQNRNPNQGQFISPNQQMLFNAQFAAQRHHLQMSPAQQQIPPAQQQIRPAQQQMPPAQQQMSPAQQQMPPAQQQMSPAQAQQMQQAFLLHHGNPPGYRPPSGHQMMGQPQLQQFPQQRFMHQSFAPLIMPARPQMTSNPQNPMIAEKGPVKTSDSTKGMMGNDALQAAFIPLQVNRASKASAKKKQTPTERSSAVAVEEADVGKNKVPSNVISDAPKKSASSGEPSDSVNKRSPEAEAVQTERKESLEKQMKPPKEKTKKKVLLAPSFFAPKR